METTQVNYPRKAAHALVLFVRRLRAAGPMAAWIFAKRRFANILLGLQNRLSRRTRVTCPCCGWSGLRFRAIDCGTLAVADVECPVCRGHERHRMMQLFLDKRPPGFASRPGIILHFAPEQQLFGRFSADPAKTNIAVDYELDRLFHSNRTGMVSDIHLLPLAANAVDGVFCLHVLEHVEDDRAAIQELYRILKPDGQAVIMVPFMMGQSHTIEYDEPDPTMFDHVRGYSPLDFRDRLAPFEYDEVLPESFMTSEEIERYKVPDSQVIYICSK